MLNKHPRTLKRVSSKHTHLSKEFVILSKYVRVSKGSVTQQMSV